LRTCLKFVSSCENTQEIGSGENFLLLRSTRYGNLKKWNQVHIHVSLQLGI